jgi:hypothetical protein
MSANEQRYLEREIAKWQQRANLAAAAGNEGGKSTFQRYVNRYSNKLKPKQSNGGVCGWIFREGRKIFTCGGGRSQGRTRKVQKSKKQKKSLTRRNRKI